MIKVVTNYLGEITINILILVCIIALSTMCFLLNMADLTLLSWFTRSFFFGSFHTRLQGVSNLGAINQRGFLPTHLWFSHGTQGAVGQILCYSRFDEAVCATRCDGFEAGLILD